MSKHEPRYAIGTKFMTRGKHPRPCVVTDILKTFNSKGDLVKVRYVAIHPFGGQTVTDYDVVDATIALGLLADSVSRSPSSSG